MKLTLHREGEDRGWPNHLLWGRMRTSTFVLIVAFLGTWWLYEAYRPPTEVPTEPATQVVPPGFVPDPEYTWVPRTKVQTPTTTTPTTTTLIPTLMGAVITLAWLAVIPSLARAVGMNAAQPEGTS